MTGVCANRDVWHTKKAVLNYFRDFEAIEVLLSHLHKNPLDCFLDTFCRERTENSCLHFLSYEEEVPAGGTYLANKEGVAQVATPAIDKHRLRRPRRQRLCD